MAEIANEEKPTMAEEHPFEIRRSQTITITFGSCKITYYDDTKTLVTIYNTLCETKKTVLTYTMGQKISITETLVKIGDNCEISIGPEEFQEIIDVFKKVNDDYEKAMELENRRLVLQKYYNMVNHPIPYFTEYIDLETDDPEKIEEYINMLKRTLSHMDQINKAKFAFEQYESKVKEMNPGVEINYGHRTPKDKKSWIPDQYYGAITLLCRNFDIPRFEEKYYVEKTYDEYL